MTQIKLNVHALGRSTLSLQGQQLFTGSTRLREALIYLVENASMQGMILHEVEVFKESIILGDLFGHINKVDAQRTSFQALLKSINTGFKTLLPNESFDRIFPSGIFVQSHGGWELSDKIVLNIDTLDFEREFNHAAHPEHEDEIKEWQKVQQLYAGPYLGRADYENDLLCFKNRRKELASLNSVAVTRLMVLERIPRKV